GIGEEDSIFFEGSEPVVILIVQPEVSVLKIINGIRIDLSDQCRHGCLKTEAYFVQLRTDGTNHVGAAVHAADVEVEQGGVRDVEIGKQAPEVGHMTST